MTPSAVDLFPPSHISRTNMRRRLNLPDEMDQPCELAPDLGLELLGGAQQWQAMPALTVRL